MSLGMSLLAQISRIFSKTAASPPLGAGRYLALIGASTLLLFSCGLLSQEVLPSPSSVASPNSRPPSPTSTLVRVTPPPSRTPTVTPLDRADATGLSTGTDVPTGGATSQTATPTILPLECLPEKGDDEYGLVKWVSGGDTIAVDLQGRQYIVRYLGIRSPDYSPFPQYMGPPAATQNASLVQGQVVRLVQDRPATDSLGRLLRYVLVYDTGLFVNYELVRQGLAQVETSIPPFACQGTFSQVQKMAQVAKLGLWAPTPTRLPTRALLPTLTWTLSPSGTPTPTPTGTLPTPTFTPTGTLPTPTGTRPTSTPTPTGTLPTPTGTLPTSTPTPTGTLPTPTGTLPTSTPTPTITPSPTSTGTPPTSTASPSPTGTV